MKKKPAGAVARKVSRKWLWLGGAAAGALLALAAYFFSGSAVVESWAASQLLQLGGTYIGPEMHFDRLTYVRPRTIVLNNLTFSATDTARGGVPVVILAVKHARLELSEIPRKGRPIRFSEVILEEPEVRMVASGVEGDGWLGFGHFIKSAGAGRAPAAEPGSAPVASTTSAATSTATAPLRKLSDWLSIRHIEIKNGKFTYESRVAGEPAVWIDGINATLNFSPQTATPGLYRLVTTISRKPALNLDVEGQLNIDTLKAEGAKVDLTLDLQEKNTHFLPAELQKLLQAHEVTGQLHATAKGKPDLLHWQRSEVSAAVDVTGARVAAGETRVAIAAWNCQAEMAGGVATLQRTDAQLLGGEAHLTATIPLEGPQPMTMKMTASNLRIQELLRKPGTDGKPLFGGRLDADVGYAAPLAAWNKQTSGGGTFSIREARIGHIPVLGTIVGEISKSLKNVSGDDGGMTDSAKGKLNFSGDAIHVEQFEGNSGAIGMRGSGTIAFDQRLDLRLNAGPMERLQDALGPLGEAWGKMSDAVAGYRVEGTLGAPTVKMEIGK